MNWDAVGAIGEIVGAVAVVATLLFVGREVRQNRRALSVSALRDTTAQWNHWSEMIAVSTDLADIVAKGNEAPESLSEAESLRYGAYVQAFFDNVESYRALVIDHRLERDLDVLVAITRRRLEIPGFWAWWKDNSDDYAGEYIDWVEQVCKAAEGGLEPESLNPRSV